MDLENPIPSYSPGSPGEYDSTPSLPIEILLHIFSFVGIGTNTRISILSSSKEIRDACLLNLWKPWGNKAYGLKRAVYRGHIGYFRRWRNRMPRETPEEGIPPSIFDYSEVSLLVTAAEKGYLDFIKMFLRDPLYNISFVDIWIAFRRACAMQRTNVIRFFLKLENSRASATPSGAEVTNTSFAPQNAPMATCKSSDFERVIPSERAYGPNDFSEAITFVGDDVLIYACKNGHYKTVKVLLEDGRFDPSALDSYCLRKACKYGHLKVVELLLNNGIADPNAGDGECIYYAVERNYTEIYEALTLDWRMQIPSDEDDTSSENLLSDEDEEELSFY